MRLSQTIKLMVSYKIDSRKISLYFLFLSIFLSISAFLIHSPGHGSMDTSMQLYEAKTGTSISWNPPLMSALMRWLGGGEKSMQSIIAFTCFFTYVPLGYLVFLIIRNNNEFNKKGVGIVRAVLCTLLLINPVIFLYVGIVWKDVLFASLLSAATALSFSTFFLKIKQRIFINLVVILLLVIASQLRQQGIFMSPLLMALPLIVIFFSDEVLLKCKLLVGIAFILIYITLFFWLQTAVNTTISGSNGISNSAGFRIIMNYDIAGVIALSKTKTLDLSVDISEEERNQIRKYYSADRVDYLDSSVIASNWLSFSDDKRKLIWKKLFFTETKAFMRHKIAAYFSLINLKGIKNSLPVFTGVSGNPDFLRAVFIAQRFDDRDRRLSDFFEKLTIFPIFRHWVYILILIFGFFKVVFSRMRLKIKCYLLTFAFAISSFYFSYFPTSISSDFRYLFSGLVLVTIFSLILILLNFKDPLFLAKKIES